MEPSINIKLDNLNLCQNIVTETDQTEKREIKKEKQKNKKIKAIQEINTELKNFKHLEFRQQRFMKQVEQQAHLKYNSQKFTSEHTLLTNESPHHYQNPNSS